MMTCSSLGAGVGVEGVEIAAACLLVLTLDISFSRSYRVRFADVGCCRVRVSCPRNWLFGSS